MVFFDKKSTFSALIRYYGRKLRDPHAVGELWGFLWLTMETHPNKTDRYYAVCLRNEYIRLAKGEDKYLSLPEQWQGATETDFMRAEFHTLLEGLTEKQKEVLLLRFVWQFTVDEIAKIQKISRQAVNQTVKRALHRIRKNTRPENVVDISKRVL